MGFYIRKSISFGPFRFNLSQSGVGLSAGVRGFRVGTGPRGNYVHMGRGGLYYRATLGAPRQHAIPSTVPDVAQPAVGSPEAMREIDSATASQIVDSSSASLVEELNAKHKKIRLWPVVLGLGVLGVFALTQQVATPEWVTVTILALTLGAAGAAWMWDRLRKTTVLFFELDASAERLYKGLHDAFGELGSCGGCWHVSAEGDVTDRKRNAGASSVVRRSGTRPRTTSPPFVKTNIAVPAVPVGTQTLYFFPDKVLIFSATSVGAISYASLKLSSSEVRFIEEQSVPRDAKVVDRTWKYVNKKGGPDKRFNNNRELPIVLYEEIDFKSATGLNERIQVSKLGIGSRLRSAIQALAEFAK